MNRKLLFDGIRRPLFRQGLSQSQVDGINLIVDKWAKLPVPHLRWLAYILATVYHETNQTMSPIKEYGGDKYYKRMYDIEGDRPHVAQNLGNLIPGDGCKYPGMGHVMLTGCKNYQFQGKKHGIDLVNNPELMLTNDVSILVLIGGMVDGDFTGKKLSDYLLDGTPTDKGLEDFAGARRIINGRDKKLKIAGYAEKFLKAIVAATLSSETVQHERVADEIVVTTDGDVLETWHHEKGAKVKGASQPLTEDQKEYMQWQAEKQEKLMREKISKPFYKSKIMITLGATAVSLLGARFGLEIPPDQLVDVLSGIASGGGILVGLFRLFGTYKAIR